MTNERRMNTLDTALLAALEAGGYFKSRYQTELVVKTKSSLADVVTDVDAECERLIRSRIRSCHPDHQILGEEAVAPGHDAAVEATRNVLGQPHLWIVDPLDGTTNFVNAIPLSVVSIAYAEHDDIQIGVVFDPYRDEVFYAVRGQGAYRSNEAEVRAWLAQADGSSLPGVRMSVSGVDELRRAVMATGLPVRHHDRALVMTNVARLVSQVKSLRTLGAAALHLAYLAAGRIDVFWEFDLNAWDMAAGVLLIQEAGGIVQDLNGQPFRLDTRDVAASSDGTLNGVVREFLNAPS
jgi:myo-inositol-1(or 4)-monophosphatase